MDARRSDHRVVCHPPAFLAAPDWRGCTHTCLVLYHCLPWSSSSPSAGIRMSSVNVIGLFSNRDSQSLRMEPQNMWPPRRRRLATNDKFVSDRSSAMTLRKFPSTSDLSFDLTIVQSLLPITPSFSPRLLPLSFHNTDPASTISRMTSV